MYLYRNHKKLPVNTYWDVGLVTAVGSFFETVGPFCEIVGKFVVIVKIVAVAIISSLV